MAKPKETKSPSVVTQEMKENRQKTYTILRALWKKHRNDEFREEIFEYEGKEVRRKKKKVDIYDFMGIPANRYAKIINGEYDMPLLKESEVLEEKTGIERGIFTGVIGVTLEGIVESSWKHYFEEKSSGKAMTEFEELIDEECAEESIRDINLWKIYRYIKYKEKFKEEAEEKKFNDLIEMINKTEFVEFDKLTDTTVKESIAKLNEVVNKLTAVQNYRRYKGITMKK